MYYFKKISLINRKLKLLKKKGKLIRCGGFNHFELKAIDIEITGINETLEYLQKEKPKPSQKVNNNSFIAAAKNDSGAKIQFPSLPNNDN